MFGATATAMPTIIMILATVVAVALSTCASSSKLSLDIHVATVSKSTTRVATPQMP